MRFTTFGSAVGAFITLLPSEQANAIRFAEPAHYLDTCPDLQLAQIGTDADAYAEVYAEAEGNRKNDLLTALNQLSQALDVQQYKVGPEESKEAAAGQCDATSEPFEKKKAKFTNGVVIALKNLEAAAQKFYTTIGFQKPYKFDQGIVDEQHEAHLKHVQGQLSYFYEDDFYTMKAYDQKIREYIGLRELVDEAVILLGKRNKTAAKQKEDVEAALRITATLTSYLRKAAWAPAPAAPKVSHYPVQGKFQLAGYAAADTYTYCFAQWCTPERPKDVSGEVSQYAVECGGSGKNEAGWTTPDLRAALQPRQKAATEE